MALPFSAAAFPAALKGSARKKRRKPLTLKRFLPFGKTWTWLRFRTDFLGIVWELLKGLILEMIIRQIIG
jgi:hypothetical protein